MVSEDIDKFVQENGGNVRDALNVALARLQALDSNQIDWARRFARALEDIFNSMESISEYTPYGEEWVYVINDRDYVDQAKQLLEDYIDFLEKCICE